MFKKNRIVTVIFAIILACAVFGTVSLAVTRVVFDDSYQFGQTIREIFDNIRCPSISTSHSMNCSGQSPVNTAKKRTFAPSIYPSQSFKPARKYTISATKAKIHHTVRIPRKIGDKMYARLTYKQVWHTLVETKGFEPSTSRMRTERSPS